MIQNQNERNQFQPVPFASPIEPAKTPEGYFGVPGPISAQQWQQPQQARRSRFSQGRNKRRLGLIAALCMIVLCCLVSFVAWRSAGPSIQDVTVYRVSMKSVDLPIGGGGIAYPVHRLDISYPFTAHILSVFVKPGERVTPNQSLVQIDLSQVNGQKLSTLQAQVAQAYQDMLAAQSYYYSVQRLGNPIVIAQAQQQYTTAQVQYNTLLSEEQAPELHQGKILSTIGGFVTAVNVYPDQLIDANKVMLTIYDESSIIVRVQIPLLNYSQIQINQHAQATPSAQSGQTYNGSVISIIPNANPQSGTFEVWVMVPNTNGMLLPGSNFYVRIQDTVNALVVPRLAVLNPDLDSNVFVLSQQQAHLRHVQVSGYAGDSVLISSGLSVNDLVVLVGLDTLQEGQTVHIQSVESELKAQQER